MKKYNLYERLHVIVFIVGVWIMSIMLFGYTYTTETESITANMGAQPKTIFAEARPQAEVNNARILSQIKANNAEIKALAKQINANTAAIAEMRGMLFSHVGGHSHAPVIAQKES